VALVASLLRRHAETARAAATPPRAGFLWWRIELRRRRELAARATRPIALLRAALGAGLTGGVTALAWTKAGEVADGAARLQTWWAAALPDAGSLASFAVSPQMGLLTAAVGGLCLLLLGLYSAWAEG
jgi:MFS superfamily sulfate permease-like transporter